MTLQRLMAARDFGRDCERRAAPKPGAIDRATSLACGWLLRHVDLPFLNRHLGHPLHDEAAISAAGHAELQVLLDSQRVELRLRGLHGPTVARCLAILSELALRTLGVRPHAEQRAGARLLLQGRLVEMDTGEGKSLTVALAAAVGGLAGIPVDVFTVNDYLAQRDAAHFAEFFASVGLAVAAVADASSGADRDRAYACDVVYVVNKTQVFEHLRARSSAQGRFRGRGLYVAIVDEADSILIDEARTPLVIAKESAQMDAELLASVWQLANGLAEADDFIIRNDERRVTLRDHVELAPLRQSVGTARTRHDRQLRELVEQALAARCLFIRDHDYIVHEGSIAIVDEFTGRVLADRSWERGLHQFVELKEGLEPSPVRETIARTTFPEFFRRYLLLSGASGTLREVAPEMMALYGCSVARVPTHRAVRRLVRGPFVHVSSAARWRRLVAEVQAALSRGQPVLVGTRSVARSEQAAAELAAAGIGCSVLNAREHASEAAIIARAGDAGRVTVATNMAGRGTDIVIGDEVRAAGGLFVIVSELHESARIDRQLMGRCARQGDPGACLLLASLEDDLFRQHLPANWLFMARSLRDGSGLLPAPLARLFRLLAQHGAEARHRAERAQLLDRDEGIASQLGFSGDRG